jgi:hypothetical protein
MKAPKKHQLLKLMRLVKANRDYGDGYSSLLPSEAVGF